jgi:hypothetical protein
MMPRVHRGHGVCSALAWSFGVSWIWWFLHDLLLSHASCTSSVDEAMYESYLPVAKCISNVDSNVEARLGCSAAA